MNRAVFPFACSVGNFNSPAVVKAIPISQAILHL